MPFGTVSVHILKEWKMRKNEMKLSQYLDGMRAATTVVELDAAIKAPFNHSYYGRTWSVICKTRIERGSSICEAHPNGRFVPRMIGRSLTVCGETYRIGRGGNSTGSRYMWHGAEKFAKGALQRNGFSMRAASRIWECWGDYPHRCLDIIDCGLKGGLADPPLNQLIFCGAGHGPVNITDESNAADGVVQRATLPCKCGGTLFDWGAGFSDGFTFVKWHCNRCSDVYSEYVTPERFTEIRRPQTVLAGV